MVLEKHRRILILALRRYQEAAREWSLAAQAARDWFPLSARRAALAIGSPGSRIRRLHEQRERALLRLAAARQLLDEARTRPRCAVLLLSRA